MASALRDIGGVLLAWALLVLSEFVVIAVTCRGLFAGNWELLLGRNLVGPIALAMLVPGAILVVALARLAGRAAESEPARRVLSVVLGALAGEVAFGVSQGRHFASLAARVPFVVTLMALAFGASYVALPRAARVLAGPFGKPIALALGLVGALAFWLVDAHVLPRLYPAFHALVFALSLASAALTVLAWRSPSRTRVPPVELTLGLVGLLVALVACLRAPSAARQLDRSDNLRLILDEHAPILGRAVHVAAWLSPPSPLDTDSAATSLPAVGEVARALDWSHQDILLVSVDALRADHLGTYGYGRATTPNLDALGKTSAVFERAYCPTPHTSYSVTSMMTGKAMRPLLSLGLGKESDTWATYLRRYGYKTAAFYPPAVFYIDAERFTDFDKSGLGFEYRWVEFTSAETKVNEVETYLASAGPEPLFMWVHLFEPHEPYVEHAEYPFGGESKLPVDAYDSEVAYSDAAIGDLLKVVRAKRPNVSIIVTADHGEEFDDHGGRYHGTTCYEEQVRVPLLVSGPGVLPRRVKTVVQTIDLLPTVLSAVGIPRPARVRGRDLGEVLAHKAADVADDPGLAYAETDDQTMVARGDDRLVCARKIAACALYDVAKDPGERVDRAADKPGVAHELRAITASIERDQGRYEAALVVWPDALRRGLQGEADAAEDVAALLDDANVVIRRKAAEVTFRLAVRDVMPQARRALERDEDEEVKRWAALGLVRLGVHADDAGISHATEKADALVHDRDARWRRAASLAFALAGDARGKAELAAWWRDEGPPRTGLDTADAKELLDAITRTRDTDAVPALVGSLDYVPLRPRLAETLGVLGDTRAKAPLLALFDTERYETARPFEARALATLGAGKELLPALALFAGLADPMTEAVGIAADAKLLDAAHGGRVFDPPAIDVDVELAVPPADHALRLWVVTVDGVDSDVPVTGSFDGRDLRPFTTSGLVHHVRVDAGDACARVATVKLHATTGIRAVWLVARVAGVPKQLVPAVVGDGGAGAPSGTR